MFLGSQIDDIVADAIISQLLLLDAQNPTKDIRLFINSPGGSLRSVFIGFLEFECIVMGEGVENCNTQKEVCKVFCVCIVQIAVGQMKYRD